MGLSKSTRILILLAIDSAFFLLELTVGYAVHSLALVADSFHMLNDVLSLCVGLWAVKVASNKTRSKMYTYGWQRAETLGALINGVFLVALCLSIFLDVIQRFVEPQEVSHPVLVLIVGSFGLASNIIGLFLFHDHGHSHGGGEHGHSHGDALGAAEEGNGATGALDSDDRAVADEGGNVADVLPESRIGNWPSTNTQRSIKFDGPGQSQRHNSTDTATSEQRRTRKHHNRTRSRAYSDIDEIYVHPASFRNEIISASRYQDSGSATESENEQAIEEEDSAPPNEESPLLKQKSKSSTTHDHKDHAHSNGNPDHSAHKHAQPADPHKASGGGHSHADLNMRGVFLHVMGDALGNIGVIASALIIWLTPWRARFYADPAISLIITIIILCSAIPLCKAASRILLQAVPAGISVDDIRADILALPGIVSAHHLHVWQLSDTKLVASLHVQVAFDFKGEGSARYMALARAIRTCLHEYGIHSSTIQPEFCLDERHVHGESASASASAGAGDGSSCGEDAAGSGSGSASDSKSPNGKKVGSKAGSKTDSLREEPTCLLECGEDCGPGKQCCGPAGSDAE